MNCKTCKWWREKEHSEGECRRFPPSIGAFPRMTGTYLLTRYDDECGEHRPIDSDGRLNKWGFKTPTEGT